MHSDLRVRIRQIIWKLTENDGTTSQAVIDSLRKNYPELIASAERQLIDRSLRRIIDDVSLNRSNEYKIHQTDLFGKYNLPTILVTKKRQGDGIDGERKRISDLTVPELIKWYEKRNAPRKQRSKYDDVAQLIEDLHTYATDYKTTIREIFEK